MMKTRTSDPWMSAGDSGRAMPRLSLNLLVSNVPRSLSFYCDVLGATQRYTDGDFAALTLQGVDFILHADHAHNHHPLYDRLQAPGPRGTGAEIRVMV